MSKRSADTERVGYEDDFQSTGPSGEAPVHRATAAQIAARKIAKPRGNRRPGAHARPLTSQASPLSQSFPAPSWGTANTNNSSSMQQPSNGFNFGQQAGNVLASSNAIGTTTSFPPFGGQNTNSSQPFNAPSATGFNFTASNVNNPFTSLNQNSSSQAPSGGFSGSIFSMPPSTPAPSKTPKIPVSEMRTPSHWMKDIPDAYKEKDPQSFFVPHAPFKWGQPDPPPQEQSQPASSNSNTSAVGQPSSQPSTGIFGQTDQSKPPTSNVFAHLQQPASSPSQTAQSKPPTSNIFAHLQQPASSPSNVFGQQPIQQSQTSNIFGQKTASPFQAQTSQSTSNLFGQTRRSQEQPSGNLGKPATSPTEEGDTMSTTPDTSPQASNDRARYGPFASVDATSKETFTNGAASEGSGSSVFGESFQSSTGLGTKVTNGELTNQSATDSTSQGNGDRPSDVSLGSPTKKQGTFPGKARSIAKPRADRPHIEEKAPVKNPFAGLNFSAPKPTTPTSPFSFSPPATSGEAKSSSSPQYNGESSSPFAKPQTQSTVVLGSNGSRQPGMPPEPPAHFSEDQKCQLITGWRLKSLDVGLQSYLRHSSYSREEMESVTSFYELRKQAILDANGGPLPEAGSKRAAEEEQPRRGLPSKKARHQHSNITTEQTNHSENMFSAGHTNPSKRKANEDLQDDGDATNGLKRSRPDDEIIYPSLPSASSSSKTAKIFGDLVGKHGQENSSDTGSSTVNGNSVAGGDTSSPAPDSKPVTSQPSIFSKGPASSSNIFAPSSTVPTSNKQSSALSFGNETTSTPLQPRSENQNAAIQNPPAQNSTPFKGFSKSQPSSNSNLGPPSSNFTTASQGPAPAHPSNTSSIFSNLSNGPTKKRSPKRKAEDHFGGHEIEGEASNSQESEEQSSKKQKSEGDNIVNTEGGKGTSSLFKAQTTKEPAGSGESIFARPSAQQANTPNMFSHLSNSPQELDDYEEDDSGNEPVGADANQTGQTDTPSMATPTPTVSSGNPSGSSVFNPFASSTFKAPPTQAAEEEKPVGRSLFDRIEKDKLGQPLKASKPVNSGDSILQTPAGGKSGSIFDQSSQTPSNNPFGAKSSTLGNSIFGNNSSNTTTDMPSGPPGFDVLGKSSGLNKAPVANMTGNKTAGDSPSGDNTWKAGTPLKFGDTSNAPNINFTSPSPSKSPFAGLFGAVKANSTSETLTSSMFKPADSAATKPAQLTFGISAPAKASAPLAHSKDLSESLAPPSGTQSESTSRATSPGATEGESGNESSDVVRDKETHPELDVTEAAKAEADEDVIFDAQGKVYKYETSGTDKKTHKWALQGSEQFRVLRHRDTNKTRMVMKLKVNGRVILNAGLQKSLSYVLAAPKKVRVPVPVNGKVETWMVSLGDEDDAKRLVGALEENKAY
ncbi:MAG: hypothetical protein LQ343_003904 [Gyalolechia ehrenbergii]|nr:MAG: hypothetical protein LQ343_003904 [Gyalolechia ehrenbergii]